MNKKNNYPKYLRDLTREERELIVQYRIEQMEKQDPDESKTLRKDFEEYLKKNNITLK